MSDAAAPSPGAPEGATAAPAASPAVPAAVNSSPGAPEVQARPGETAAPAAPKGGPGEADPDQVAAALEGKTSRKLRPIKTQTLPGVVSSEDDDLFEGTIPERGPDGKFLKRSGAGSVAPPAPPGGVGGEGKPAAVPALPGEAAPEGEAAPAKVLAPDPKTGKIKFADKDYDSPAQIEQEFRTLRGMFKPLNDRIQKTTEERDYGYSAAQAWIKEVEKRDARIAELEGRAGGRAAGSAVPASAVPGGGDASALPNVADIVGELDMETFEAVAVEGGLPQAGRYLAEQILQAVTGKVVPALQAQHAAALAPYNQAREQSQAAQNLQAVADSVAALELPDGSQAWPELGDAVAMGKVAQMWQAAGNPAELAMTPGGLMAAISLYRAANGWRPSAPAVVTPPAAPAVPTSHPAPALAASVEDGGGGPLPTNTGRSHLTPAQARFAAAFDDKSDLDDRRTYGFARNRPAQATA
jgi:hypothetical protein